MISVQIDPARPAEPMVQDTTALVLVPPRGRQVWIADDGAAVFVKTRDDLQAGQFVAARLFDWPKLAHYFPGGGHRAYAAAEWLKLHVDGLRIMTDKPKPPARDPDLVF